jgi:hypothetical protein
LVNWLARIEAFEGGIEKMSEFGLRPGGKAETKILKVGRSEDRKVKWAKGTSWIGICGDEN